MSETVEQVQVSLVSPDRFYIGGEWLAPSSPDRFDVIEPSTEDHFLSVAAARADDISAAVAAARDAFDNGPWPHLSHAERAGYLQAMAAEIRVRAAELAHIWSSETGVLSSMAIGISELAATVFEYYAGLADTFPFVERKAPTAGGNVGLLVREPVGVVGAIIPWNGPLGLIPYKTGPALLAGCTVVVKSSPEAPGEAYVLAEIAEKIGLPPGVFNIVTADREVSELLVRDPRVDKITFTGSTAAGRRIGAIMGGRIGRYTLELGGKSAAVVFDDYDIDQVADVITSQACVMTGQVCAALTRVVVSRSRHDEMVDALTSRFTTVRVGDPYHPDTMMGPLAGRRQLDRVQGYIETGKADGAKLAGGGGRPHGLDRGFFIEPTVFADVDNSSTIAQEEIFGPVVAVIPADDDRQAIDIANDSIYGLNASVFTNDIDRAYAAGRRIRSGTVGHNAIRMDFGIAFGGFKQSGVGREGGVEGLHPFLEPKTMILDAVPAAVAREVRPEA